MSDVAPETPGVEPVPVVQQQPSNAKDESFVAEVEEKVVDAVEAVKRLIGLVEQHRTIGDAEVGAAVADVKSTLPADEPPAEAEAEAPPAPAEGAPAEAPAEAQTDAVQA